MNGSVAVVVIVTDTSTEHAKEVVDDAMNLEENIELVQHFGPALRGVCK